MLHTCPKCKRANYIYEPEGGSVSRSIGENDDEVRVSTVIFTETRKTRKSKWVQVEKEIGNVKDGVFKCEQCGDESPAPDRPFVDKTIEGPDGKFRVLVSLSSERWESCGSTPDEFDGEEADCWMNNMQETEGGQWVEA